ncbi:ABC transporter permease [Pseudomonas helleri]|uniref:ABC transporter permease n=1 Tax=Pseudomonas helleri TaxID=1608996 RepID=A0A6A7YWJ7_9PSED|nr:ABC transporter permease [Pseudomonas helleri]MQT27914.1 ABC transporter permease [Pseudomonas helleri]MQT81392.1 ABC transporter permease [Pseudomonas helleri]MQU17801.1 ABC transporter permease [Pseudomonas helleri]MQU28409.1 ABC transporter permease [Pseudomonas helleri]
MNLSLSINRVRSKPWLWSFLAALLVWLATLAFTRGEGAAALTSGALAFSAFFVIVGVGQMFVITTGPGNIDLSIPANIALSGAVGMKLMDGQDGLIALGVAGVLGVGVLIGCANYALIRLLRIPPIIATLSASFLLQSMAIAYGRSVRIAPPELFYQFSTGKVLGIPYLAVAVGVLTVIAGYVLSRSLYGRWTLAVGQNMRAAELAGVRVERVRWATYVLSAVFASVCGVMLAGFSGGASLSMGDEYLLASIAVVVIGGTSVAGGFSNVPGLWGAALFLYLLVSMLNTFGASAGVRLILTGVIIIAVIAAVSGRKSLRSL